MTAAAPPPPPAAPAPAALPRLLLVDDEPAVLEALAVNLRRGFEIETATSGTVGLEHLSARADFAVVMSDMRMPKMDGATFLARARELAPDATRMLLTGQADLDAAIKAVNQGQIFRFLTKPCPRDALRAAIDSAVAQHRLITAERVLLEQTLRGSIKMLVDVLAITSPAAFGRANQIKTRVLQLANLLGILDSWQLEVAALASQLGYIVLPHALCGKLETGAPLTEDERRMIERAPAMTEQLLANIPRLENVRAMLALHTRPPKRRRNADPTTQLIELGAHLLRVSIDIEALEATRTDAQRSPVAPLLARTDLYDPEVLHAVEQLHHERAPRFVVKAIPPRALCVGMILAEDVRLATGNLLVARGYEVTASFIERVRNFPPGVFTGDVRIVVPC
ncbi:MAG TPA: HD domain-containing phosphohydrolase [Kofleriaceae bacterium]|nr:HD domain-containing phosphohydrolase [Kofleriaceae bacterium]